MEIANVMEHEAIAKQKFAQDGVWQLCIRCRGPVDSVLEQTCFLKNSVRCTFSIVRWDEIIWNILDENRVKSLQMTFSWWITQVVFYFHFRTMSSKLSMCSIIICMCYQFHTGACSECFIIFAPSVYVCLKSSYFALIWDNCLMLLSRW